MSSKFSVAEFEPKPISKAPGWNQFEIDRGNGWEKLEGVVRARSVNPNLAGGTGMYFGESFEGGYDGWFRIGAGGGLIWAYAIDEDGKIQLGRIVRKRLTRGLLSSEEAARGMVEGAETPEDTAAREGSEEFGRRLYKPIKISEVPFNADSAFFISAAGFPKGDIDVFAKEVAFSDLKPNPNGEGYVFTDDAVTDAQKVEGIKTVIFYPDSAKRIRDCGDGPTKAGYVDWQVYRDEHIIPNLPTPAIRPPYSAD